MSATAERFTPEWWQDIQNRHDERAASGGFSEAGGDQDESASPEAAAASLNRFTDHGQVASPDVTP